MAVTGKGSRKPPATEKSGGKLGNRFPKRKQRKLTKGRPVRLAPKLREIRTKLGLSQGEMLRRLGFEDQVERDYVSKWERGVLELPLQVLCSYADVANVYVDALIRDNYDLPEAIPSPRKTAGVPVS